MPRQRPTTNVLPDSSLPHAFYWGSESGYGGVYKVLGRNKNHQVLIHRVFNISNYVVSEAQAEMHKPYLTEWPMYARVSIVLRFKTDQCLQNFLLNPKTAFGLVGSDSEPGIDLAASNA